MPRKKYRQRSMDGTDIIKTRYHKSTNAARTYFETSTQDPKEIMDIVEQEYKRDKFYCLTSGGKDSQTVLDFVNEIGKLTGVVHIKTNIGLSMTSDFVKDFCQSRGYPCHIIEPRHKYIYVARVLEDGFPGPNQHSKIMAFLKYHTMRDFALSMDKERHCMVSGVRKFESARRKQRYVSPIQSDGSFWTCAPYFYKSDQDVYREFLTKGLPITPAYDRGFPTSGECLCGSFGSIDEKRKIGEVDPKLAEFISWLEEGVKKFGTEKAKRYSSWGITGTTRMEDLDRDGKLDDYQDIEAMICGQECGLGTMKEFETNPVNEK